MFKHWPWQANPHVCQYCRSGFYLRSQFEAHLISDEHRRQYQYCKDAKIPKYHPIQYAKQWREASFNQGELSREHFLRLNTTFPLTADDIDTSTLSRRDDPLAPGSPWVLNTVNSYFQAPAQPAVRTPQRVATPLLDEQSTNAPTVTQTLNTPMNSLMSMLSPISPLSGASNSEPQHHASPAMQESPLKINTVPTNTFTATGATAMAPVATSTTATGLLMPSTTMPLPQPTVNRPLTILPNVTSQPPQVDRALLTPLPSAVRPQPHPLPNPGERRHLLNTTLPSPKRRRTNATSTGTEQQVRNASTTFDQNVIIARTLDNIKDLLNDLEYKIQQKTKELCEAQSEDIITRCGNVVAEEIYTAEEYSKELISTLQDNIFHGMSQASRVTNNTNEAQEESV